MIFFLHFKHKSSSKVLKKAEDEEITANIEANKVKKENLEVTGAKCWRGKWQSALRFTGEIFN